MMVRSHDPPHRMWVPPADGALQPVDGALAAKGGLSQSGRVRVGIRGVPTRGGHEVWRPGLSIERSGGHTGKALSERGLAVPDGGLIGVGNRLRRERFVGGPCDVGPYKPATMIATHADPR